MGKLPPFDSLIEKARGDVERVHALSVQLAAALRVVPEGSAKGVYEDETAQLAQLRAMKADFEAALLALVHDIAVRTDRAYAAFDAVDEVGGFQAFMAFFRRREAPSFKVIRTRKLAIAESLRILLLEAATGHRLIDEAKKRFSPLVLSCEPQILSSMEKRRGIVSAMDEARQRDRELAALIGTVRRKITNASDEDRQQALRVEEEEASTRHAEVLLEREKLADAHQILDRQAVLLADLIDVLNDLIVVFTLAINKISVEAERCIQLYDAVYGSMEPLLANARPHSSKAEDEPDAIPLGAFLPLLMLHTQGTVTMQDIEKRKARADQALSLRKSDTAKAGAR
jgi:hypothetical protein